MGGADTINALCGIQRVTGTGQTAARPDKDTGSDLHSGGVQNDAIVVDDRQAVGVDIEAVITAEIRLNKGKRMTGSQ